MEPPVNRWLGFEVIPKKSHTFSKWNSYTYRADFHTTEFAINTMPSFKLKFSLGFITSCYVIFSLSMVQAMDIFMITWQYVTKPRENFNLKEGTVTWNCPLYTMIMWNPFKIALLLLYQQRNPTVFLCHLHCRDVQCVNRKLNWL